MGKFARNTFAACGSHAWQDLTQMPFLLHRLEFLAG
jgi:hypothetical protein